MKLQYIYFYNAIWAYIFVSTRSFITPNYNPLDLCPTQQHEKLKVRLSKFKSWSVVKGKEEQEIDFLPPRKLCKRIASILFLTTILFASNNINERALGVDEAATGMRCVTSYCSKELSQCLSNGSCAQGLGCFMGCATTDAVKGNVGNEGACQVRCMDLYQNKLLDEFTECSLTKNRCYEPLQADQK